MSTVARVPSPGRLGYLKVLPRLGCVPRDSSHEENRMHLSSICLKEKVDEKQIDLSRAKGLQGRLATGGK